MTEPLHLPDPPISLSGVRLRPWATADVDALVAAWRDPEMHRWMPEEAHPFEAEQARAFVDDAATLEKPWTFTYALKRMPDYTLLEYVCEDNREYADEKGVQRIRIDTPAR